MPNPHSVFYHPLMYAYNRDTWALAGDPSEPTKGPTGTGWTDAWLYLNNDSQSSRSELSTHNTITYDT
jgi:hypothetical protein